MKGVLTKSLFLLFLLLISGTAYSQAMCPIEFLKVNKINGKIEFNDKTRQPFRNVKLDLRTDDDGQSLISKSTTNENGFFEFTGVTKGKYILIANFEIDGRPFFEYRSVVKVKETNSFKSRPSILIRFDIDCFKTEISTIK